VYKSIDEIKKANALAGGKWFSPDTMHFFRSHILPYVYGGRYFITSEQPPYGDRVYSIRVAQEDGSIDNVGKFGAYASAKEAQRAVYELVNGGIDRPGLWEEEGV